MMLQVAGGIILAVLFFYVLSFTIIVLALKAETADEKADQKAVREALEGKSSSPPPSSNAGDPIRSLTSTALRGDATAQRRLGEHYRDGKLVPQNDTEAVEWFRMAADQGEAVAQTALGMLYERGRGTMLDYTEAVKWYRKAAVQGDKPAQYNLGSLYYDGKGVEKNHAAAYFWLILASASGDKDAGARRDKAARFLTREQATEVQRRAAEWKPRDWSYALDGG